MALLPWPRALAEPSNCHRGGVSRNRSAVALTDLAGRPIVDPFGRRSRGSQPAACDGVSTPCDWTSQVGELNANIDTLVTHQFPALAEVLGHRRTEHVHRARRR